MRKGTILSVDDDQNLQVVVSQYLEDDGYKVISVSDSASALEAIGSAEIDVILLDLILPDDEGVNLIPRFRSENNAPIIVVSGKSDTTEKIVCLEMGADDYITKPFEMRELSARIKAVLRRTNDNAGSAAVDGGASEAVAGAPGSGPVKYEKILFNEWCLDRSQYQLFDKDEEPAELTTGEFKLLEALIMAPNRAMSRERLFEITRDGEFDAYDRAIDIQIARLRKKLKDDSNLIKTVRGVGYMFTGKTEAA